MRKTLTDLICQNAKSAQAQTEIFDALTTGLALRVTDHGKKTWTFTFTSPRDQKRARLTLGTYPATSLKDARTQASALRGAIERGRDPRDEAPLTPTEKTVKELVDDYLRLEVNGKLRSAAVIARRLENSVVNVVGGVPITTFRISHLNRVIDPIIARGSPIQANRTFESVRALFNFAVRRGEIEFSPIAKARAPSKENTCERYLSREEIVSVWRGLTGAMAGSDHVPTILRLCLITGQRVGEVAGMTRSEIDIARGLWIIPKERAKNGHEHWVPLPELALEIVRERLRETNGEFLFPNAAGTAFLNYAVDRTLHRAQAAREGMPMGKFGIPHWTPHDLRRTVATQMSEALRIPEFHISCVLNHISATRGSITQKVYNRNQYLDEKREALEKWATFLSGLVAGGNVVPLQARAA